MRFLVALPILALALAACSTGTGPGSHAGEPYMVKPPHTLFYTYGPAQPSGPDYALAQGQRVTMLSYEFGYSHIAVSGNGQAGYVATEDLVPAPPLASQNSVPLAASRGHHRHSADSRPPTAEEQSQIPLPEFPESEPPPSAPHFRY